MKNTELVEKAVLIARDTVTAYMWGTCGYPITKDLIRNKSEQYPLRYSNSRQKHLNDIAPIGVWGWDCAGLIKGILWGWNNDATKSRGGATYGSNGMPDTNVTGIRDMCHDMTSDMGFVTEGELVFAPGHVGIYVGDGMVVHATLTNSVDGVVVEPLDTTDFCEHGRLNLIEYPDPVRSTTIRIDWNARTVEVVNDDG